MRLNRARTDSYAEETKADDPGQQPVQLPYAFYYQDVTRLFARCGHSAYLIPFDAPPAGAPHTITARVSLNALRVPWHRLLKFNAYVTDGTRAGDFPAGLVSADWQLFWSLGPHDPDETLGPPQAVGFSAIGGILNPPQGPVSGAEIVPVAADLPEWVSRMLLHQETTDNLLVDDILLRFRPGENAQNGATDPNLTLLAQVSGIADSTNLGLYIHIAYSTGAHRYPEK